MAKVFDYAEVAKHTTSDSCWVVLYGSVYDVTSFLPSHPGGSKIILSLAGQDATEEYDPVHPPGTLEESLSPSAKLGSIDPTTIPASQHINASPEDDMEEDVEVDMADVLNLDEMEAVATKKISRKAWAYYYSAADDTLSKSLNNSVYKSILLRPRIFIDCVACDTSTSLLGTAYGTPLYVSPAAMARLGHPSGEQGIASGISSFGACQIISNNASQTPEQIVADCRPGQSFGWQLYVQNDRSKSEKMLARINALPAIKFIVLTLDAAVPGKREEDERSGKVVPKAAKKGRKEAEASPDKDAEGKDIEGGGGVGKQLFFGTAADLTWSPTLHWLTAHTSLPIVLKGIQTHEDAFLASRHPSVRGIILSNHGGRALDTAPPAMHTLLEIRKYCPEVFERIEVWVDGGIKRGTDVVKALCAGAKAVGVGRAALFGLGAGGVEGVKRTFEILQAEIETCMRLLGVAKISELGPQHINTRALERDIYDGVSGLEGGNAVGARAKL